LKSIKQIEEEKANDSTALNGKEEIVKNEKNGKNDKKIDNNKKKPLKMEEEDRNDGQNEREKELFKFIYSYIENDKKKFIEITDYDMKTLEKDKFLNDTIINFFLK